MSFVQRLLNLLDTQHDHVTCPSWLNCWSDSTSTNQDTPYSCEKQQNASKDETMDTTLSYEEQSDAEGSDMDRRTRSGDNTRNINDKSIKQRRRHASKGFFDNSILHDEDGLSSSFSLKYRQDRGSPQTKIVASLSESHLQQRALVDTWPRQEPPTALTDLLDLSIIPTHESMETEASPSKSDNQPQSQTHPSHWTCPSPSNPQAPRTRIPPSPPNTKQSTQEKSNKLPPLNKDSPDTLPQQQQLQVHSALRKLARLCRRLDVMDRQAHELKIRLQDSTAILFALMKQFDSSKSVQVEAYRVITILAQYSHEFCQASTHPINSRSLPQGTSLLKSILSGMRRFMDKEDVQVHGTGALIMLLRGSEDRCHDFVLQQHGADLVVAAMRNFSDSRDMQELGLILFALVCEFPQTRLPVVKAGGLRVADEAMQRHPDDVPVVMLAQKAIVRFCKEQHLYDDEGKHCFRFYQEPTRQSSVKVDEKSGPDGQTNKADQPSNDSVCKTNELAVNLVKALLKPK